MKKNLLILLLSSILTKHGSKGVRTNQIMAEQCPNVAFFGVINFFEGGLVRLKQHRNFYSR